jgi:hypothetical protein
LGEHLPCKQGGSGSNPLVSMVWAPDAAREALVGKREGARPEVCEEGS